MILRCKRILNILIKNRLLLKEFNIKLENLDYKKLYKNFDFYLNIYVLINFLKRV